MNLIAKLDLAHLLLVQAESPEEKGQPPGYGKRPGNRFGGDTEIVYPDDEIENQV